MKLTADKLESHLNKEMLPVYVISGVEPLLVMECADLVRHRAKK